MFDSGIPVSFTIIFAREGELGRAVGKACASEKGKRQPENKNFKKTKERGCIIFLQVLSFCHRIVTGHAGKT
jgi:hypothetical protein